MNKFSDRLDRGGNLDVTLDDRDHRLAEVLDHYMTTLETEGIPPDLDQLVAQHPDLAQEIRQYTESLNLLHRTVSHLGDDPVGEALPQAASCKRLGDFEIIRQIGRGGMGIVYEARQISLNRTVALKILPFAAMLDERQIARFRTEAQAAAQMHHPNIVSVYAVGHERGVHFFAMQFIEGQSLEAALKGLRDGVPTLADGQLTKGYSTPSNTPEPSLGDEETALAETLGGQSFSTHASTHSRLYCQSVARLALQAARALHHAHEYGIVHRDVKPSNLLLDRNGKLWVTDFGLARIQCDTGVTVSGDVVGTLRYMSPEQAAGKNALVDARTDVYALGATLYELLTLQQVYSADQRELLLRQIETVEPTSPRKLNGSIEEDLEAIVLCALAKSRDERYETAEALAEDLQRFLSGEPTRARRPTWFDRGSRWVMRHRRVAAITVALLAVFAMTCAVGAGLVMREKGRTETALVAAKENLERAEKHFQQARQVVDHFGSGLADQLATLPGTAPVRRQLLSDTLQYYRDFITHAADDPALQHELARTYFEAAGIAEQLGDRAAARADYQNALEVYTALTVRSPQDVGLILDQAKCHNSLGLLLSGQGNFDQAEREFQQAMALVDLLPPGSGQRTEQVRLLAETCSNLGLMYGQTGRQQLATQSLNQSLALLHKLLKQDPNRTRVRHDLAICFNNLSYLQRTANHEQAADACGQAIAILTDLVKEEPRNLDYRSDLALFHNNFAAIEARDGHWQAACESYRQAASLQRQLLRQAPHMVMHRYGLATTLSNLGQALHEGGENEPAVQAFSEAAQLAEALVDDFPSEVQFLSLAGGVLNNLGMIQEQSGQSAAALDSYAMAVARQQAAFERAPRAQQFRDFLSKHYYNYGRALRDAGQAKRAGEVALERRELWTDDGPHLQEVAIELAQAAQQLAATGQSEQSLRLAQEAKATLLAAQTAGYDGAETSQPMDEQTQQTAAIGRGSQWPQRIEELIATEGRGQ